MGAAGLPRDGAPTGIAVLGHGSGPTSVELSAEVQ